MHERAGQQATRFRGLTQQEMLTRLGKDLDKLMGILEPMSPEEWTGFVVPHFYMGPVPAFFYAAGQVMDDVADYWPGADCESYSPAGWPPGSRCLATRAVGVRGSSSMSCQ
jgi:hypothetical protein